VDVDVDVDVIDGAAANGDAVAAVVDTASAATKKTTMPPI
jgi:hypothetical protein